MLRVLSLLALLASAFGIPPRASLLQSGSRSQASSSSDKFQRSSALAGFQTFAEGLAAKYLEEGQEPDQDLKDQIDIVIQWIDNMFGHLQTAGEIDRTQVSESHTSLLACAPTAAAIDDAKGAQTRTAEKRLLHSNCRRTEGQCKATTNQACVAYDTYRENNDLALLTKQANCALTGHLSDAYIQADQDDGTLLDDMETCLDLTKTWHSALYQKFIECKRPPCVVTPLRCEINQTDFEATHCESKLAQNNLCEQFKSCVQQKEAICNHVCENVAIDVGARKADYETGQRIKCLLLVLRDAKETEKPSALKACIDKPYNTDEFNIECLVPSVPIPSIGDVSCDAELGAVSCSEGFLTAEYKWSSGASFPGNFGSPFEHVDRCKCHACLALEGSRPHESECPTEGGGSYSLGGDHHHHHHKHKHKVHHDPKAQQQGDEASSKPTHEDDYSYGYDYSS